MSGSVSRSFYMSHSAQPSRRFLKLFTELAETTDCSRYSQRADWRNLTGCSYDSSGLSSWTGDHGDCRYFYCIPSSLCLFLFRERELTFTFAICYRPSVCLSSVCLSVVCLSVTFVRPTQAAQIFGNISTALGTLAIRGHPLKILQRSSQGNPSAGGVKDKRGSQI